MEEESKLSTQQVCEADRWIGLAGRQAGDLMGCLVIKQQVGDRAGRLSNWQAGWGCAGLRHSGKQGSGLILKPGREVMGNCSSRISEIELVSGKND